MSYKSYYDLKKELNKLEALLNDLQTIRALCNDKQFRFSENLASSWTSMIPSLEDLPLIEPCHEKTGFSHMRKQRCRSASR